MLSNVSITKFLQSGDIVIDPWNENMLGAAKVTLHLGNHLVKPKGDNVVDVVHNTLPEYDDIAITTTQPYRLKSKEFILGETLEKIGISTKIGMLMEGRSTLARLGLSVTQTASIVDTGEKPKTMTFEIFNAGPNDVLLYPKMKFCRAIFFLIYPPATIRYDTNGRYQRGDSNRPIFRDEVTK